ncbi:glycerophosphodiester phosphodiesterase family protein [Corynebacterium freiburgense]|uniref:glycerophosphodiester phosphodiesterase family protein n=1 Tax=Corynebacterium freiburgense TaxID=556548 RepID=UPI000684FFB6|nr:glycerophosphodiester phosphodiesterase family protein [Corynebacterium freiburgense]WJZ03803.1 cytoplasmic glycerophosphodiester phosphodiesterase [Corynebacterium freiburgense]
MWKTLEHSRIWGYNGDMESGKSIEIYPLPSGFDLQSHRGGRGHWTEESATAFRNSLALGVSTLELDIVLTKDGVPAVWHDPILLPEKCGSRHGEVIRELLWEDLQRVECAKLLPDFPEAQVVSGNRIIQLRDVFGLAEGHEVHFNIETKIEADRPYLSAGPEEFVTAILRAVREAGVEKRVMIQSFDWRTFPIVYAADPRIPLVALWDATTWYPESPWGPYGHIIDVAKRHHISVLSPDYALVTQELLERAHENSMRVVPWTVNTEDKMRQLINMGVDGLITDYPKLLKNVLAQT